MISRTRATTRSTSRSPSGWRRSRTTASRAPTASSPLPTRPSIAPRTKGATWCVNERATLCPLRVRLPGRRALLPARRHDARRGAGEGEDPRPPVEHRRTHPAAAVQGAGAGPRLLALEPGPGRPLRGAEEAGRGRDVVRVPREGDRFRPGSGDQG